MVSWKDAALIKLSVLKEAFGNTQEEGFSRCGFTTTLVSPFVFSFKDCLLQRFHQPRSRRITHIKNFHATEHLSHDNFNVFIVNVNTLQTINFLNFVHQVFSQFLITQDFQDIVRIRATIHQRFAGSYKFALANTNVFSLGNKVFLLLTDLRSNNYTLFTFEVFTETYITIDLTDDSCLFRFAGFK